MGSPPLTFLFDADAPAEDSQPQRLPMLRRRGQSLASLAAGPDCYSRLPNQNPSLHRPVGCDILVTAWAKGEDASKSVAISRRVLLTSLGHLVV